VVQETLLKAQRSFGGFAGSTAVELRGWLRAILLNSVRDAARRYREGGKRDFKREEELHAVLASPERGATLAQVATPSQHIQVAEQALQLRSALSQLSADHRQVIVLRSIERKSFQQVGEAMQRSSEAARKLWLRAVDRLRELLGASRDVA
jgi:RNA polymerase sigma-70 factor (ECF subfamily)